MYSGRIYFIHVVLNGLLHSGIHPSRRQLTMKKPFLFIGLSLLIIFAGVLAWTMINRDHQQLKRLDETIRMRHQYEEPRREQIRKSIAEYQRATDDTARYNALRNLYENYRSFRIDSALIVARQRLDIARRIGEPSKIASASINLAEGYTRLGSANIALHILDTLNPKGLQDYHLKYLNSVRREAYRTKLKSTILEEDQMDLRKKFGEYSDSLLHLSDKNSRGYYTLTAERYSDSGLHDYAVNTIEQAKHQYDFSEDPAMLATIGEIYLKAGQREKAKEYLAAAATLDITSGIKEYRSLTFLTSILLEEGDIDRAFEYITCAFEDAQFSHASYRTTEIMEIMPVIDRAFHESEVQKNRNVRTFLIVGGILMTAAVMLLIWYIKALHSNRRMLTTIEDINSKLAEQNDALAKADALKLDYIRTLMKANSAYITRLTDFRKNIYRLLKTGKYEDALQLSKSRRNETSAITVFQELFDEAVLSIFPSFREDINEYMKEKIEVTDRLTPELRVIAMMKLGIASTDEISSMFHYSNQTVYNLRNSIRNMINIPWEEFEEKITGQ